MSEDFNHRAQLKLISGVRSSDTLGLNEKFLRHIPNVPRDLCSGESKEFEREKDNIVISDYRHSATWIEGRSS